MDLEKVGRPVLYTDTGKPSQLVAIITFLRKIGRHWYFQIRSFILLVIHWSFRGNSTAWFLLVKFLKNFWHSIFSTFRVIFEFKRISWMRREFWYRFCQNRSIFTTSFALPKFENEASKHNLKGTKTGVKLVWFSKLWYQTIPLDRQNSLKAKVLENF